MVWNTQYIVDTITVQEQGVFEMKLQQVERMRVSSVIKIENAIRVDQIEDDREFNFVSKDLRKEVEKIGRLLSMVIPRRKDGCHEGVGKVFVEFENEQYAKLGVIFLNGQRYDGKELAVTFYDPRHYSDKMY